MDSHQQNVTDQIGNTMRETDKKCPNCGGTMDFYPATGKLRCPYCESEFDIDPENEIGLEQDLSSAINTGNAEWGTATKTIICKSCGGESVYDANTLSSVCPYCGSNQVMETESDTLAPGGVCTFKVTKEQASSKFRSWIGKKIFCPSAAKKNCMPDAFKGVYVPLWTFDTYTVTEYTARYGIDRHYTDDDGNTRTRTDWYRTSGTHREFVDDHPVLATDRYDTKMFSALLPFNTAQNKAYKPEFLAGFAAEKYSVGLKEGWRRAKETISKLLTDHIKYRIERENNADRVESLKTHMYYYDIRYKYLLAPIWISSYKYKNKVYNMMVNGETGKTSGKYPVSALRIIALIAVILLFIIIIAKVVNG